MNSFDDMTRSLYDIYLKLVIQGKRTATITRLRMELAGLDRERRDLYSRLGERFDELRKSGQVNDAGLLLLLETEFNRIENIQKKIQDTMASIQSVNFDGEPEEEFHFDDAGTVNAGDKQNLLDSFGVL